MSRLELPAAGRRRFLLAAGAASLLGGCNHVIGPPLSMQLYRLEPGGGAGADLPAVTWRLAVGTPETSEALDTERIALSRSATTLDYYADSAWTDRVPSLLLGVLVRRFEESGHILGVARDTDGLHADYLLETEIRDFSAHYPQKDGPPVVELRMALRLVRLPAREIVATGEVDRQATAARNDLDAVVEAFDEAGGAALDQIVAWTLRAPTPG